MSRTTSGHTAGRRSRFTVRTLAIALLLVGLAGGASVAPPDQRQPTGAGTAADALAEEVAAGEQRRIEAAVERADRSRRDAERAAAAEAEAEAEAEAQRVGRAEEAEVQVPQEESPPPESSSGGAPAGAPAGEPAGPVPADCGEYSGNRATGCTLLLESGFGLDQMSCLDNLWTKESGWNHLASNPSSGAYGIPQALPGNKMATHGDDWETNPATQIRWGLSYIENRYSTPCGAWSFFQSNNWY